MENLVILGVNLILLVLSWRFIFKPAIRDMVKDQFFDLRENLRERFLKGDGLDHPAYQVIRGYLNNHIRSIEDESLIKMVRFRQLLNQDDATSNYIKEQYVKVEEICGDEYKKLLECYRLSANRWLKVYLIHSSSFLTVFFYIALLFFMICAIPSILSNLRPRKNGPAYEVYRERVDETLNDGLLEGYAGAVMA